MLNIILTFLAFVTNVSANDTAGNPYRFTVNIAETKNYSEKQTHKLADAILLIETILNSEEFKQRILNHTYRGELRFVHNRGMSNEEIYKTLMAARESYSDTDDHQMDLNLAMYYSRKKVIGYTSPDSSWINTNSRYYNSFKPYSVAGNLVHEWTHKIGFGHDFRSTSRRPYSVPYAVGNIVVEMGRQLSETGEENMQAQKIEHL